MRKTQENEIKATLKGLASNTIEVECALKRIKEVIETGEDDLLERAINLMATAQCNLENILEHSHGGESSPSLGGCTTRVAPAL